LVGHYENHGIYHLLELFQDMVTPQADGESIIQYPNRLVRLHRQLALVGEDVHDRRVIIYLMKGLRNEYDYITDTWNVLSLNMDAVKRDLRQKGMRIGIRAQLRVEPQTPTAFAASHDDASTDTLNMHVSYQPTVVFVCVLTTDNSIITTAQNRVPCPQCRYASRHAFRSANLLGP
jgi:hypothetical protein